MSDDNDTRDGAPEGLLESVRAEMGRAIGFDNDAELTESRERALLFARGDMDKDVPAIPNRSRAVSTDLADAVETLLPDLMEIFTGGEDVVAFTPVRPEDERAARQETDYLTHVVFQDNPGFREFYQAIKDALLLKTGIFKFWWNEKKRNESERFRGKNAAEVMLAGQEGEILDLVREDGEGAITPGMMPAVAGDAMSPPAQFVAPLAPEPTYSFTLKRTRDLSNATYKAIPPDDFAVAHDTVAVEDTTYCVFRSRPRVQDLIADGFDADEVRDLAAYAADNNVVQQARDTAGEHSTCAAGGGDSDDLRQVEIREHHIRLLNDEGALTLWCCVSDAAATRLLARGGRTAWQVSRIPFAAGSPYLVSHRFYGESLADKLFEIQRIRTTLTRAVLDSTYFSLNQRVEVAMDRANSYTMVDLLRNEPGMPVRSKSGDATRAIQSGGLGFDPYGALEYFATIGEQRSGIVRNAQGLNPDTLHDTAKGAMALMQAAQKRTRMIARVLAETMFKPLYLGLHAECRENANNTQRLVRLGGAWVEVDPGTWAERSAMTIEVGLGASGRDAELAGYARIAQVMASIVAGQGGAASGPIVLPQNVYAAARDLFAKLTKKGDAYLTDPAKAMPQAPAAPDPRAAEMHARLALQQQQQQFEQQAALAKVHADAIAAQAQAANEMQLERERLEAEIGRKRQQFEAEIALKRQQIEAELVLKREAAAAGLSLPGTRVHLGGEPG